MTKARAHNLLRVRSVRIGATCLVLLLAALLYPVLTEPRFEGKRISEWIARLPYDNASGSDSNRALRHFGPRAVPYLIDAIKRPVKWKSGPLSRIPKRYLDRFIDTEVAESVQMAALWRLRELSHEEMLENEITGNPKRPISDRAITILTQALPHLSLHMQGSYITAFAHAIPQYTNVLPQVRAIWKTFVPGRYYEWVSTAEVLAAARDTNIIPDLIQVVNTNKSNLPILEAAVLALGKLGQPSPEVIQTIQAVLQPDNHPRMRRTAAVACAYLAISPPEARDDTLEESLDEERNFNDRYYLAAKPVLKWLHDSNDLEASAAIKQNLNAPPVRYFIRGVTTELLERAGPKAEVFTPELAELLHSDVPIFSAAAARALRAIDPARAAIELRRKEAPSF